MTNREANPEQSFVYRARFFRCEIRESHIGQGPMWPVAVSPVSGW
jgi:hypothetical protein